jgi:hypothetical protein
MVWDPGDEADSLRSLFFGGTTFLSFYTLKYYQFNGKLPGYDRIGPRPHDIDPDKAAFSMAPQDEEAYTALDGDEHETEHSAPYNADSYGSRPMFDSETEYRPHSVSPAPQENPFDIRSHSQSPHSDVYSAAYGATPEAGPQIYAPPASEPFDDDAPAHFPMGNYDRTLR